MLTASVLILFGVTYWFAVDYAARDENNEIDVEYASILDEARTDGISKLPEIIDSHMRLRKDVRGVYLLEDSGGRKITGNIPAMTPVLGPTTLVRPIDGRLVEVRAHGYHLQNGDYFLVGQDTATLRQMNALILRTFAVEIVITLHSCRRRHRNRRDHGSQAGRYGEPYSARHHGRRYVAARARARNTG